MIIEELQEKFKQHLETKFTRAEAKIEIYPDTPENYNLGTANAAVLINYRGGSYKGVMLGTTKRPMIFEFRVVSKKYGSDTGVISLLEKVIKELWFYKPYPDKQLYLAPIQDGFVRRDAGLWQYFYRAEITTNFTGQ